MDIKTKFDIGENVFAFCLCDTGGQTPETRLYQGIINHIDIKLHQVYDGNQGGMITVKDETYTINIRNVEGCGDVNIKRVSHLIFKTVEDAIKYITKDIKS